MTTRSAIEEEMVILVLELASLATIRRSVWDGPREWSADECQEYLADIVDDARYMAEQWQWSDL